MSVAKPYRLSYTTWGARAKKSYKSEAAWQRELARARRVDPEGWVALYVLGDTKQSDRYGRSRFAQR